MPWLTRSRSRQTRNTRSQLAHRVFQSQDGSRPGGSVDLLQAPATLARCRQLASENVAWDLLIRSDFEREWGGRNLSRFRRRGGRKSRVARFPHTTYTPRLACLQELIFQDAFCAAMDFGRS